MKKIEELKWQEYFLSELFEITSTKSSIDRNKLTGELGDYPYVTRSDTDNGMDSFIGIQPEYFKDEGNVITIGLDTQTVFYQPADFYTGQNIQVLRNEHLNKYVAMFIVPLIKKQMKKFNWGGNGATLGRLRKVTLLLPSTDCSLPDYSYMEEYMKQMEVTFLRRYKNFLISKSIISELEKENSNTETKKVNWKEFDIKDIFTQIKRGRRLKTDDHIEGIMPYVSSSAIDNGVDDFVSNDEGVRIFSQCLTIANSGSVGATFYHPYAFVASDHVTSLANGEMNRYIYLFISTITKRLSGNYSFNREIKDSRIQREKIMLPITDNGKPDYKYMESYMRNVEYRLLNRYINKRLKQLDDV